MADLAAAAEQLARAAQQAAQHLALGEVRDGMQRLETKLHSLEQLAIAHNLQFALKHADIAGPYIPCPGRFGQYKNYCDNDLEREVLQAFLRNKGWPIPNVLHAPTQLNPYTQTHAGPTEEDRQVFRDALVDRLTVLTGMKPRVVREVDAEGREQHVIYRA